ncbi:Endonuclease MutS2 [compost metagenome]
MGIAISVLEELYDKGATICATTHYNEIKNFAEKHEGFINGSMEFDIETLKPLYKLNIGKPGESNAFLIALRLGMEKKLIEKAHEIAYKEKVDYSQYKIVNTNKLEETKINEEKIEKIKILEKKNNQVKEKPKEPLFNIGDSVFISFMNRTGVICEAENSKGEYGVMVMRKKIRINKKRLSLYIDKEELYPEDYDFDVIFESKENRKKNKVMNKRHVDGMIINIEDK